MYIRAVLLLFLAYGLAFAKLNVVVSIPPQSYFVERIAGDLADVKIMLPPGISPETFTPAPADLRMLKEADLYFLIGVGFEKAWLDRFKKVNPNLTFVDTTATIEKIPMEKTATRRKHHGGLDPHVWLSPANVAKMVPLIRDALIARDPAHAADYRRNASRFLQEIEALDRKIGEILSGAKRRTFIVFHPAFGYFAKSYGLKQIAIEKEGKEPTLRYFKKVIDFAREHDIHTIFVAPQFSEKSARYIAEKIGGDVKTIDPLAKNWRENLIEVAKSLEKAD